MQNACQQNWWVMIAMNQRKLEAARQPNGCDCSNVATISESLPEVEFIGNSCSINNGTQKEPGEIKTYTNNKFLLWQL